MACGYFQHLVTDNIGAEQKSFVCCGKLLLLFIIIIFLGALPYRSYVLSWVKSACKAWQADEP